MASEIFIVSNVIYRYRDPTFARALQQCIYNIAFQSPSLRIKAERQTSPFYLCQHGRSLWVCQGFSSDSRNDDGGSAGGNLVKRCSDFLRREHRPGQRLLPMAITER